MICSTPYVVHAGRLEVKSILGPATTRGKGDWIGGKYSTGSADCHAHVDVRAGGDVSPETDTGNTGCCVIPGPVGLSGPHKPFAVGTASVGKVA